MNTQLYYKGKTYSRNENFLAIWFHLETEVGLKTAVSSEPRAASREAVTHCWGSPSQQKETSSCSNLANNNNS